MISYLNDIHDQDFSDNIKDFITDCQQEMIDFVVEGYQPDLDDDCTIDFNDAMNLASQDTLCRLLEYLLSDIYYNYHIPEFTDDELEINLCELLTKDSLEQIVIKINAKLKDSNTGE